MGGGSSKKSPAPPPPPPPAPRIEMPEEVDAAKRSVRKRQTQARGRESQILAGGMMKTRTMENEQLKNILG